MKENETKANEVKKNENESEVTPVIPKEDLHAFVIWYTEKTTGSKLGEVKKCQMSGEDLKAWAKPAENSDFNLMQALEALG